MNRFMSAPITKVVGIPLALGAVYWGSQVLSHHEAAPVYHPVQTLGLAAAPAPVREMPKAVNQDFTVARARQLKSGAYLDEAGGMLITCRPGLVPDPHALVGRTIHVLGTTSTFRGRPRIVAGAITVKE